MNFKKSPFAPQKFPIRKSSNNLLLESRRNHEWNLEWINSKITKNIRSTNFFREQDSIRSIDERLSLSLSLSLSICNFNFEAVTLASWGEGKEEETWKDIEGVRTFVKRKKKEKKKFRPHRIFRVPHRP